MSLRHQAVAVSVLNPKGPYPVTSWVQCLLFSPSDHDLSKMSEQPLSAPSNTSHLVPCTYVHPSGLLAVFLSCRYCFPPTDSARRPRELGGLRTILCSEICGKALSTSSFFPYGHTEQWAHTLLAFPSAADILTETFLLALNLFY